VENNGLRRPFMTVFWMGAISERMR